MHFHTSKLDELRAAVDEYENATEGRRTVGRRFICQDRDEPGRYAVIVFFESYEEAMKNSALPETDALSKQTVALTNGSLTFSNLDIVEERS
jgi:hypothetical protein